MGRSVPFPTVPSGVIGGTQFDPVHQFSPTWLGGTESKKEDKPPPEVPPNVLKDVPTQGQSAPKPPPPPP